MCGRFVVYSAGEQLRDLLGLPSVPRFEPRYNIAITDPVLAVRSSSDSNEREMVPLRWGLIPWWAKDERFGHRCFNARSETVAAKPAFRDAFERQRCLIPANGFYEWRHGPGKKHKQPFYFHFADGRPFAFAGLWSRWKNGDTVIESCTILTTTPNTLIAPFHDRMPVIVPPNDFGFWLDHNDRDEARLEQLFAPTPARWMATHMVDPRVNKVASQGADLIEPHVPFERQPSLF